MEGGIFMYSTGAGLGVGIIIAIIYFIFVLFFLGLWIYAFVLFVKLAKRGIKALDIYIDGKSTKQPSHVFLNDNTDN
jgi:type IV secretory pathway TrbD component